MSYVLTAGSFDIIHQGHEALLRKAFSLGKPVKIGLASDAFIRDYKENEPYESYPTRKLKLSKVADEYKTPYHIFPFDDIFGDAITNTEYSDIVVAKTSKLNASLINKKRAHPLKIHVADMTYDEYGEKYVSSERIRAGLIDTDGKVFFSPLHIEDIYISGSQRKELQFDIWGELVSNDPKICRESIAVGDATCIKLKKHDISAFVYDHTIERIPLKLHEQFKPPHGYIALYVDNPAAIVTRELQEILFKHVNSRFALQISGEEDLAALAFLLAYPLNTCIYYGLPNKGLVELPCTLHWKRKAYNLLYGSKRS